MGLRGVFTAALPGIFSAAGETATFTPSGGAAIPCMVFIDFNVDLQPAGVETQVWARGTTIEALLSASAGIGIGTSIPDRGDVFVVDGVSYSVREITASDGLTVKMVVV
jgi:hypothetical protein